MIYCQCQYYHTLGIWGPGTLLGLQGLPEGHPNLRRECVPEDRCYGRKGTSHGDIPWLTGPRACLSCWIRLVGQKQGEKTVLQLNLIKALKTITSTLNSTQKHTDSSLKQWCHMCQIANIIYKLFLHFISAEASKCFSRRSWAHCSSPSRA